MKIFIVGLPQSGRTTVAKAIVEAQGYQYVDAMSWVRSTFREPNKEEHPHQYEDEYQEYLTKRYNVNPWFVTDYIHEMMKIRGRSETSGDPDVVFVIDGIQSPRDFIAMFDFRQDVIVFLNRTGHDVDVRDHENIGTSVIRDYCFWMSAAGLLSKKRWLEYNFRIPGEDSDFIKPMGAQNSVFIVRSIKRAISHLTETLTELTRK